MKILPNNIAVVEGDNYASKYVVEKGCLNYDDDLINMVKQHIPIGGVVLDIGACLGDQQTSANQPVSLFRGLL